MDWPLQHVSQYPPKCKCTFFTIWQLIHSIFQSIANYNHSKRITHTLISSALSSGKSVAFRTHAIAPPLYSRSLSSIFCSFSRTCYVYCFCSSLLYEASNSKINVQVIQMLYKLVYKLFYHTLSSCIRAITVKTLVITCLLQSNLISSMLLIVAYHCSK